MREPLDSHGSRCSAVNERPCLTHTLLPLPVGTRARLNNAAPLLQPHYRAFITTTRCSAPVLRIGTLVLMDLATWTSPLASERQVLTFHTRAWCGLAPSSRRTPLDRYQIILRACPGRMGSPRFRRHLISFRRFIDRFACARLPAPCLPRSCLDYSATLTTIALDDSSLQRLEACF